MRKIFLGILVGAVAIAGYNHLRRPSLAASEAEVVEEEAVEAQSADEVAGTVSTASRFQCDGRIHCSQMTSCEEAIYFLQHCPGVKMDGGKGGGDGVPCERQWCGSR